MAMIPLSRKSLTGLARLAFTAGVLVLLWQITDGAAVLALLAQASWGWLAAALIAAHGQVVLSALRWRLTAARLGQPLRRRAAIGEYYLSQFINLAVPGGVLGDAGRALRQRHQAGLLRAAQAVVLERLVGQVALFAVLFAGVAVAVAVPGGLDLPVWVARVAVWSAALLAGLAVAALVVMRLPGRVARATAGFGAALRVAVLARDVWPRQVALSLAIVACNLGSFAFCAMATGTDLPFVAVVTVLPMILISMMIPFSVGGWGLREGAAAALWPVLGGVAAGAGPEAGIAASIAFGLVILAASLPGIAPLLLARLAPQQPASGPR